MSFGLYIYICNAHYASPLDLFIHKNFRVDFHLFFIFFLQIKAKKPFYSINFDKKKYYRSLVFPFFLSCMFCCY